jgi:GntR family transcriptional regulator
VIESGLEELESLHTLARRIGLETRMGEAEIVEREATPDEAGRLNVPAGAPVLAISRVMMTGAQPIAYLVDVVPIAFLRRQDLEETFNGSVLDLFLQRSQPALSHSRTDIMTATADGTLARKLGLRRGGMLLKLEAQLCARDGQIVDYSLSYFVPGHFRFHVVRRVGKINGESTLAKA